MRILDLFCCAGGAGVGYSRAGFDVVGIDVKPQRNYPFEFHQADAIEYLSEHGHEFDAIHASPPCQLYSITSNAHTNEHPDLVGPTREALVASDKPYVIENVEGAPLMEPLLLCASEFGLRAPDVDGVELALKRHRLFESNVWLMGAGGCRHDGTQIAGSYTGSRHRKPEHRDNPERRGGYTPALTVRRELMGIDWMNEHELAQAIPPAYTEFIGHQLMTHLMEVAA
ncbi:DNA (cytosine-5)-methyltransferase 1 [Agromyces sp. CF514]|uniref:DNA cytosine methyltransferase n=1 Tax=Agromyces sp. CF514 TaxID=1881031 RepID=UPI0008E6FB81|nr:DNA cytosine methyltransferase [Agromyces sp. CF514]SFR75948.1 DNA (cytosine-5)-methyltransferase 1 [Agromyces sp. CF514]